MKYYVLYNNGKLRGEFHYYESATSLAECTEFTTVYPVALVKVTPREELIENEMEAQLRSVFNDIPGVSFSHQ